MKAIRILLGAFLCAASAHGENSQIKVVSKPTGTYSSMLTERAAQNEQMQGALIRAMWVDLEPSPGVFDFSKIDAQLKLLPLGKKWTLAIHGGWTSIESTESSEGIRIPFKRAASPQRPLKPHMSPPWLVSEFNAETFVINFRGTAVNLPKYWDPVIQNRLALLMKAVATKYKEDERLMLIYVPQMTCNGLEGHFNGVPNKTLLSAAKLKPTESLAFEKIWTTAAIATIRSTAEAFDNKAIAFEVHELLGSSAIPQQIMAEILRHPQLSQQVGVAMWWLSGKTTYQPELLKAIEAFPGDVYGQIIGRSSQPKRFPNGNYGAVFKQAKALGIRYIEPWNYEFENHTYDALFEDFNHYSNARFTP